MATIARCPYCDGKIRLGETAKPSFITCPSCRRAFTPTMVLNEDDPRRKGAAAAVPVPVPVSTSSVTAKAPADDDDEPDRVEAGAPSSGSATVGLLATAGFVSACFGLASAPLLGNRPVTTTLSIVGLVAVALGFLLTLRNPRFTDMIKLSVGGVVSIATLGLMLMSPGTLYSNWAMDREVPLPPRDPNLLVAISSNKDGGTVRTLAPGEWVDAAGEWIRQDDVSFRIMAVRRAPLNKDKAEGPQVLLIQFRLANVGLGRPIEFEGFRKDKNQPILKDEAGKSYAFQEQRKKASPRGVKIPATNLGIVKLIPRDSVDYELVFEAPPKKAAPLKLDLPASAWGRLGVCNFHISGVFEPAQPAQKKAREKP